VGAIKLSSAKRGAQKKKRRKGFYGWSPRKPTRLAPVFKEKRGKTMNSIADNLKRFLKKFFDWGGFNSLALALLQGDVVTGMIIIIIYQFVIIIFGNYLD
jgi:hypothetical protein